MTALPPAGRERVMTFNSAQGGECLNIMLVDSCCLFAPDSIVFATRGAEIRPKFFGGHKMGKPLGGVANSRNSLNRSTCGLSTVIWPVPQQLGVMAFHRLVALTRAVLQCFRIEDLDFPAGVFD
jgi:hypothetical protein